MNSVKLAADQISSAHVVRTALGTDQHLVVLSGVLIPNVKGSGTAWQQVTLRAELPITGLPAGQRFTASQWAPSVSIAAADQDAATDIPGWAIDGFGLVGADQPSTAVTLEIQTAVRDSSCFLLRVAYQVTLVGTIA